MEVNDPSKSLTVFLYSPLHCEHVSGIIISPVSGILVIDRTCGVVYSYCKFVLLKFSNPDITTQ